jgi:hypothetical protein
VIGQPQEAPIIQPKLINALLLTPYITSHLLIGLRLNQIAVLMHLVAISANSGRIHNAKTTIY